MPPSRLIAFESSLSAQPVMRATRQVGDTDRAVSLSFNNWTPMIKKKPVDFSMDTRNQPRSRVGNRCESASI
jgi:hypothetical protein